jgi:AcrR family transcriptional regulator
MTKHKSQDERRAQILEAARTCFIRNGYGHTRVDDIAKEAGLSKGGVYFHFSSKREIFDALLERQQAKTAAIVAEAQGAQGTVVEKLSRLGGALTRAFADAGDHGKFLVVLAEMGIREDDIFKRVADAHATYVELIAQFIRQGIDGGELREVDANMAALFIKLITDGVEQGLALGYEFETERFLAAGLDILFNGLRPRP